MSLTVAIIAGGKSSRFGSPKALAEFRSKRLIDHALVLAHELSDNVVVCCGKAPLPLNKSIRQLPDSVPDCGPIGGLLSALEVCKTDWLAIMPCDMPLLTADTYKKLLSCKKEESGVVAMSPFGIQPLVSVWPVSIRKAVAEQIRLQQHSMRALAQKVQLTEIPFLSDSHSACFQNVNTRLELQKIESN